MSRLEAGDCLLILAQEDTTPLDITLQDSLAFVRTSGERQALGTYHGELEELRDPDALSSALQTLDRPLVVVLKDAHLALGTAGKLQVGGDGGASGFPVLAYVPPCRPESLGDAGFCGDHGIRYPYLAGAMANGIGSEEVVEAMGRAGMLAFFGSAGLPLDRVRQAVERITANLGDMPFGFNLIHSPNERGMEEDVVDLYLERGVRLVEASAFLQLTPAVIRYRLHGIHRSGAGEVIAPNRIIAKVSREEIAEKFFSPPPEKILGKLLDAGKITTEEAELAREIPVAQDITAEADSGGHTDHRPALALLPTLCSVRDRLQKQHGYARPLRVGLAGGIATPESAAAAFAMGAAYVLTGSVNQACREAGTSDDVRQMLAETRQADVARAPAADMFEMGVTVQVLKRGTMFSMRAGKLYQLYRSCNSLDEIPPDEREKLEKTVFRRSLDEVWEETRAFFLERDPRQIERAENKPKYKMALVFRWYLGQSSNWANSGLSDRKVDYQIWCGPAMGAFNEWAKGSFLEDWENRDVVTVARNILYGAAVLQRANALAQQGIAVSSKVRRIEALTSAQLDERLDVEAIDEQKVG